MPRITPILVLAAVLTLIPLLAAGFFREACQCWIRRCPRPWRILAPVVLAIPYVLVSVPGGSFRWAWLLLYLLLPLAVTLLLDYAARIDPAQLGAWPDLLVLASLGLAVDLRWLEPAWPARLAVFNKILLLDLGIWGIFAVRELRGAGFDLRVKLRDLRNGGREFLFFLPIALTLGLTLSFLHVHRTLPRPLTALGALIFTFLFVAVPEELFFRGWVQNLLERRLGRTASLLLTSTLFGLSHFNKRAVHFNWRYVLLAAIAGIFYGRAWRSERRVAASSVAHTLVDTVWSLWLR